MDDYVDQVRRASKREAEIHFLGRLLAEYSAEEVSVALTYVLKLGVLGGGEPCHSPLKYLLIAIEQVLSKAKKAAAFLALTEATTQAEKKVECEAKADATARESLRRTALATFESDLSPELQTKYLADVTSRNSVKNYAPPLNVLRSMAALKWYQESTGKNQL